VLTSIEIQEEIRENGFATRESVLSTRVINELLVALERVSQGSSVRMRGGIFAIRNLLDAFPVVRELADSGAIRSLVEPVLGPHAFPVRGIFFDKVPCANWKVPWHQDVTIAVQERIEAEGFGPWTIKAGVLHVQAPASVLERMISVRLHLDECNEENGALRVIPGSHHRGRTPEEAIASLRLSARELACPVGIGGALLMRPLLLHASSPSRTPAHRRVIHLDFASVQLPPGIKWFSEAVH
jgi:hypothetical protein